jgi:diguanylate cyclase (GGDEF)-like protein/PAS domain S-box-containing protein
MAGSKGRHRAGGTILAAAPREASRQGNTPHALHESEQLFSLLVKSTVEYAIYTLDTGGFVTSWNPGAAAIKGYAAEEMLGRHFGIFFTAEDQQADKPARILLKAQADGQFREEGWRVRKDGTRFWASVLLESMRDAEGRLVGFAKITRDETKKRTDEDARDAQFKALAAARTELETAYDRLKLATDSGGIGIWDWDIQADVLLWDDWMHRLYGTTPQPGPHGYDLWRRRLHPDDRAATEQALADGVSGVKPFDTEFRVIWHDGSIHYLRASGYVTRDATGQALHMIGCNWDVTPLRLAEKARDEQWAQSKRWLELAEEIANVGHWTISVPDQKLFWSDEIYRIHGLKKGTYTPDFVSAINMFHVDDVESVTAHFNRAIADRSGYEWQARLIRPCGEVRYVLSRGVVQVNDRDEVTSIFGVFIDMTEQKEIEDRLAKANLLVTKANEELRIMAHIDGLTGLPNRRAFDRTLDVEFRRAIREKLPISLIMIDLDDFKGFNDCYGHLAGDRCLRNVTSAISAALRRPTDLAARYGGEEIAIVLPNTNRAGAQLVTQSILEVVRALGIEHQKSPERIVTVSCGVATVEGAAEPSQQIALVESADRALYRAKKDGKNRASHARCLATGALL